MSHRKIYALIDPRGDLLVRYVGISSNPKQRMCNSVSGIKRGYMSGRKDRWIAELMEQGLRPIITILDAKGDSETEEKWCKVHQATILNCSLTGTRWGSKHSGETISRLQGRRPKATRDAMVKGWEARRLRLGLPPGWRVLQRLASEQLQGETIHGEG